MSEAVQINVQEELDRIEAQWPRIEKHLIDEPYIGRHADTVSKWGVGQQLLHLLRTLKMISGGIQQMLTATAPMPTLLAAPPGDVSEFKREVLRGGIPRGVGTSPDFLRIDTAPSLDEIRRELADARAAFYAIKGRAADIEAAEATFPHHHLGDMKAQEWTRFIGHHTELHLGIIDDVLSATGG